MKLDFIGIFKIILKKFQKLFKVKLKNKAVSNKFREKLSNQTNIKEI